MYNNTVRVVERDWAIALFEVPDNERREALKKVFRETRNVTVIWPDGAEGWLWRGIVASSYARELNPFSRTEAADIAHSSLLRALEIDENVGNGAANAYLGELFTHSAGHDIGFGHKEKAYEYLQRALEIDENNIDACIFLGKLLISDDRLEEAHTILRSATELPTRPGRRRADEGFHRIATALLEEIEDDIR